MAKQCVVAQTVHNLPECGQIDAPRRRDAARIESSWLLPADVALEGRAALLSMHAHWLVLLSPPCCTALPPL